MNRAAANANEAQETAAEPTAENTEKESDGVVEQQLQQRKVKLQQLLPLIKVARKSLMIQVNRASQKQ